MSQLTVSNASLGYEGRSVVKHLSFEVRAGDYLCVIGENGTGKSTLIKTLLGLQPPLSGTFAWGDGLKPNEVGYLPQQSAVQRDFPATVREVVLSGCLNRAAGRPFYSREDRARAAERMARLDISALAKRCYRELSGGQQQRVLLARALCAADRLLVLDEPVAGLDPHATAELYALIEGLNREGMTILMVSHDLGAALRYASHILNLSDDPAWFGAKSDYLESESGRRFIRRAGGDAA